MTYENPLNISLRNLKTFNGPRLLGHDVCGRSALLRGDR